MVNIEIDGIYCKKCNTLHPTLMWHNKYNDYERNREEKWKNSMKKHFPEHIKDTPFKDSLALRGLKEEEVEKECEICGCKTFFKEITTDKYVCSDECKYKLLGLI